MKRTPLKPLLGTLAASVLLMAPALGQDIDPDADSLPQPEIPIGAPEAVPCGEAAPQLFAQNPLPKSPSSLPPAAQQPAAPTKKAGQPKAAQPKPPVAPPGTAQPQRVVVGDTTIFGDTLENDPATGLIVFTGNAKAVQGPDEVRGDRLIYNPKTGEFTAEGNVVILQGGREIHTTRATYRFADATGEIANLTEKYGPYYIRSESAKLHAGPVYEALRATLTTCDREHPHYGFYARQIEIIPGKEMIARHVGIDFLGHRIATIPRYRKSLAPTGEDDDRSLYPSFGYSSNTGPYVRKEFSLQHRAPLWVDADVQLNTFVEPSGGILAATPGNGQLRGTIYYRDVAENQRVRFLRVSRLPELGWVWTPRDNPQPGQFLPHQIGSVHYPRELAITGKWRLAGEVSGGYFRQHRGDDITGPDSESKNAGRMKLQVQAVKPRLDLGPLRLNDIRLMGRQTLYDNGDTFGLLGTGIGKRVRFGNLRLGIIRLDQFTTGSTPFMFDDVELQQEWRPRLEYITPGFRFSYTARIRGQSGGLYDQIFSISKVFHCIEPRLTVRTRRMDVFLEISIPGLSGFSKGRPGQSRTVGPDDAAGGTE